MACPWAKNLVPWDSGMYISETTGRIYTVRSSVEWSRPAIVQYPFAHLAYMDLLIGQNAINSWMDFLNLKFYRIDQNCNCAAAWAFDPYGLVFGPEQSFKELDGFALFKVLWNCLDL